LIDGGSDFVVSGCNFARPSAIYRFTLTGFDPDEGHRVKQDFGLLVRENAADGERDAEL